MRYVSNNHFLDNLWDIQRYYETSKDILRNVNIETKTKTIKRDKVRTQLEHEKSCPKSCYKIVVYI